MGTLKIYTNQNGGDNYGISLIKTVATIPVSKITQTHIENIWYSHKELRPRSTFFYFNFHVAGSSKSAAASKFVKFNHACSSLGINTIIYDVPSSATLQDKRFARQTFNLFQSLWLMRKEFNLDV